jgi:hypothetical protein
MLSELNNNKSPIEYSCAAVELGDIRVRILAQYIAHNESLKAIDMSNK